MRVGIDVTPLLGHPTGVGVFTRELVVELTRRTDVRVRGYAATWRGRADLAGRLPAGVETGRLPMAARPLRTAWSRFDYPPIEWWTGPIDVVHGTNFVVPPTRRSAAVVTVHDLTPVRFPELCSRDTLAYPALVRRAVRRGAWVHTPSEFVAGEVREWLAGELGPDRVVAVANGVTPVGGGDPAAGRRLAGTDRSYVAALATIEPRKDHVTLLAAFELFAARVPDVDLVVAGPDGWGVDSFNAALATNRARDRIHRLGWLDGTQRADLLAGAVALAFPSVYEGFGLPTLEAMSAGVAVVCSDAGPLPEVTGDAALRAPVGDAQAFATALVTVVEDSAVRERLVAAGHRRVGQFSWQACAAGLCDLYERAVTLS